MVKFFHSLYHLLRKIHLLSEPFRHSSGTAKRHPFLERPRLSAAAHEIPVLCQLRHYRGLVPVVFGFGCQSHGVSAFQIINHALGQEEEDFRVEGSANNFFDGIF